MISKVGLVAGLISAGLLFGGAAQAQEFSGKKAGDFVVRVRTLGVIPDESSTITVIGGSAKATNSMVPEADFSYFITDEIAVELIAAVTKHTVSATGTALGTVPLGSAWLLPPTLTVQYHPLPEERLSPYIGFGLNFTHVFGVTKPSAGPVTAIKYTDSFGPALQAGVDYALDEHWSLNVDVKKIWIQTDVSLNGGAIKADVSLDPWIIGLGVGYRL